MATTLVLDAAFGWSLSLSLGLSGSFVACNTVRGFGFGVFVPLEVLQDYH